MNNIDKIKEATANAEKMIKDSAANAEKLIKDSAASAEEIIKDSAASTEHKIKETTANAEEMARKVWLAGLGAYGKSYEDLKGRFESLSTDSNKLFDELVAKGQKLETEGKNRVEAVKNKVASTADIESRIEKVRSKLGFNKNDSDQQVEELSAKIDELTAVVAKLAAKKA